MPAPPRVIETIDARFEQTLEELKDLVRIPSVSAAGFPAGEVVRSAEAVAELLRDVGLERVDVAAPDGGHPAVLAEWLGAGDSAPTLLLYAHHDVQPPGRPQFWQTPAFEPTLRGDGRLYGRGVVDDKAGVLVFAAAVRAWLETEGALPVNVKLVVEGEEEIGSLHLARFLDANRARLAADVIVLSDTSNLETGLPSITTSLRGILNIDLHVRALDHPVHSGIWGGPLPDAASALGVILGRLFDPRGQVAVPGFDEDVPPLAESVRAQLAALPFDEPAFRADGGLLAGVSLAGDSSLSVYERIWARPALAVTALEAVPLASAANQLVDRAAARIGVRLAPGQDPDRMRQRMLAHLTARPPWGVEVEATCEAAVAGWRIDASGPAFAAARRALADGYGRQPVEIGCGGTIPFVAPFSEVLGGVPALLLGLEDPICNAHGENESLHVGDFRSACRAAAHLFAELRHPKAR